MIEIKVVDLQELAELVHELIKKGVTADVKKEGDGYWHVRVTGF
jgi:hypothetical protein